MARDRDSKELIFTRQSQEFGIGGGINQLVSNYVTKSTDCLILENCRVDKRLGQAMIRGGSLKEEVIGGEGGNPYPMGMGEYIEKNSGAVPITRTILAGFSGSTFRSKVNNDWNLVTVNPFTLQPASPTQNLFTEDRQYTFTQIGANTPLFIGAGRYCKWSTTSSDIDRVGIVPPTGTITIASTATAGAITLTTGTQYMHTYYSSATGLESDWSPLSADVGAVTSKRINITIPTSVNYLNYDKIRIYRTLDGGVFPYLVAEINATVTSYEDNTTDAQLTARANDKFDNAVPPDNVFICTKYANRIWVVDADNPNTLRYSKPFTGSNSDLEYFPQLNYLSTNDVITGVINVPGRLLIFHPKSISYLTGYSDDSFQFQTYKGGCGTLHHHTISSNGEHVFFLSEQGWMLLTLGDGSIRCVSQEIEHELQPILSGVYNSGAFFSSCWQPSMRQYVFTASIFSDSAVLWEDVDSGATVEWEDNATFETVEWEDDVIGDNDIMKVLCMGFSPSKSIDNRMNWHKYTWAGIPNDNTDGYRINFIFQPQPDSNSIGTQNDYTYLGVVGSGTNRIWSIFRGDTNEDFGTPFTFKLLTGRIVPGDQTGRFKLFERLTFDNAYSDPTHAGAVIKYLIDFDDAQIRNYQSELITVLNNDEDVKRFPQMQARHIHLYVEGESIADNDIDSGRRNIISNFTIQYRETLKRGGR